MFRIRLATSEDAQSIRDIYAPYIESSAISFDSVVPSVDEIRATIVARLQEFPWLVAECDHAVIGYAYASRHRERVAYRWSVDVSVYIDKEYRRRGLGKLLYQELLSILKTQRFRMVYAGITIPNESSVGLHEHLGFEQVAFYRNVGHKFGEWRDVGWWALDLHGGNSPKTPAEPVPFSELDAPVSR